MTITAVHTATIPTSTTIEDPSSDAGKAWLKFLEAGTKASGHNAFWGRETENSNRVWMIRDWESVAARDAAGNDPDVAAALTTLMSGIIEGPALVFHADLAGSTDKAVQAPLTEILMLTFASVDDSAKANCEKIGQECRDQAAASSAPSKPIGAIGGWTMENDIPFGDLLGSEQKGAAFVSVLGWDGLEAHKSFSDTDVGEANRARFRSVGAQGIKAAYIPMKKA